MHGLLTHVLTLLVSHAAALVDDDFDVAPHRAPSAPAVVNLLDVELQRAFAPLPPTIGARLCDATLPALLMRALWLVELECVLLFC